MSKIVIEIDDNVFSLKIDGNEVKDLSSISLYGYRYCNCGDDICFSYEVSPEKGEKEDFRRNVRYIYDPAKASFGEGKLVVNTKHPTKEDYKGL